jgi:hypothetical protein
MISSITLRRHGGAEFASLNTSSFSFLAIDFSSQSSPPHLLYHHLISSDYDWQALSSAAIILACYFLFLWLRTLYFRTHPLVTSAKVVIDGTMSPNVDLAIVFKAGSSSLLKSAIRDEAAQAEKQYTKLIDTLKSGGLYAVGRRGETRDQLLVLVYCPQEKIASLVQHERYVTTLLFQNKSRDSHHTTTVDIPTSFTASPPLTSPRSVTPPPPTNSRRPTVCASFMAM